MPNPSEPHPLADLPVSLRIDVTLAVLSAMEVQKQGGWALADLADLCGCSEAAIVARQQRALERAQHRASHLLSDFKPFSKTPNA
jgi:DNA-directed RNA polymerase specialized sigma24 family protein